MRTSCGVLVTDGARLLIGHATRSVRWDIPKGLAEPGEDLCAAARRELEEETGLRAPAAALRPLGMHAYMPGKDLALFAWEPEAMPDPAGLVCRSAVLLPNGRRIPECDRFAVLGWDVAITKLGKNMARVLRGLQHSPDWPFRPMTRK